MTKSLYQCLREIKANKKVADVEDGFLDDGRIFVHLNPEWDFGTDPCQRIGTKSFDTGRAAALAVKAAIPTKDHRHD